MRQRSGALHGRGAPPAGRRGFALLALAVAGVAILATGDPGMAGGGSLSGTRVAPDAGMAGHGSVGGLDRNSSVAPEVGVTGNRGAGAPRESRLLLDPLVEDATLADRDFTFLAFGDTQRPKRDRAMGDAVRLALYERARQALADSSADLVFHLGDIVDKGGRLHQWERSFDEPFWNRLSPWERRRFYPILGNHEYKDHDYQYGGCSLRHYFDRFAHLGGRRYYWLRHGRACFVALDSGRNGVRKVLRGEGWQNGHGEQLEWLEETVLPRIEAWREAGEVDCVFVLFHKPPYATPGKVRNRDSERMVERFERLNRAGEQPLRIATLNGHIHTFAHLRTGDDERAVDLVTSGGGGATQHGEKRYGAVTSPEGLDLYRRQQYEERRQGDGVDVDLLRQLTRDNTHYGYLEVTVGEQVRVVYQRYDVETGAFRPEYEFSR